MDKINHTTGPDLQTVPSKRCRQADPALFKQSLQKALAKPQNERSQATPTMAPPPLAPVIAKQANGTITTVVAHTDRLLDKLNHYMRDLRNPDKSLKDIHPMLQELQQQATHLIQEAQSISDPTLARIASQTAITAHLEYVKFQRGDYI